MDTETGGNRSRLVRVLLAVGLGILALRSLRGGKRLRGLLAGVGAVALGVSATGEKGPAVEPLHETDHTDFDTGTDSSASLDDDADDVAVVSDDETEAADEDAVEEVAAEEADDDGAVAGASGSLICAACGEAIVAGQRRRPNADDETVHDDCL
jgi:hypothetical protein